MADLTDLREAIRAILIGDATLKALVGYTLAQPRIYYRRIRREMVVPCIMLSDTGGRPDPTVPLEDRLFRVDVFHQDFEKANTICERVRALLHNRPPAAGSGWRPMALLYQGDGEEEVEEGDVVQRVAVFRLLAYETS